MSRHLKPFTYALMHFVVAVSVTFAITRSATAAFSIGLIEPLFQTVAYMAHERLWLEKEKIRQAPPHCPVV